MRQPIWFRMLRRWRFPLSALIDTTLWFVTLFLASLARYGFQAESIDRTSYLSIALTAAAAQLIGGVGLGLYRGRRAIASFGEVGLLVATSLTTGAITTLAVVLVGPPHLLPISAVMAATAYQMLGALGIRYVVRLGVEMKSRSRHQREHRTLIFGAGDAGDQIVREIRRDPASDLDPVAFLDDDVTKRRLRRQGIPVAGNRHRMAKVASMYSADTLLIALPSASQESLNQIADAGLKAGLAVKVLPTVAELVGGQVGVSDIRDLEMADFLNRAEVDIDTGSVSRYIEGKRVLVTGAGGSIGSELCRAILKFNPSQLTMLDHDENALHALELSIEGRALLMNPDLVLCDIRDSAALRTVFEINHPQVVFHAAAHKHVTFLERFPSEGYKTNVQGSSNVLEAAAATGVETYVNISTDKAVDAVSVLGTTKRKAELLTAEQNTTSGGRFLSVRFGNVLGSNGSVLPTFLNQIRNGEPITVTDPDATRYFMTVNEAVLLVLQAGALAEGGDVLVLDMGEPVRIVDLATRLASAIQPGVEPDIVYTGLRPGEKRHEILTIKGERPLACDHPRMVRFLVSSDADADNPVPSPFGS